MSANSFSFQVLSDKTKRFFSNYPIISGIVSGFLIVFAYILISCVITEINFSHQPFIEFRFGEQKHETKYNEYNIFFRILISIIYSVVYLLICVIKFIIAFPIAIIKYLLCTVKSPKFRHFKIVVRLPAFLDLPLKNTLTDLIIFMYKLSCLFRHILRWILYPFKSVFRLFKRLFNSICKFFTLCLDKYLCYDYDQKCCEEEEYEEVQEEQEPEFIGETGGNVTVNEPVPEDLMKQINQSLTEFVRNYDLYKEGLNSIEGLLNGLEKDIQELSQLEKDQIKENLKESLAKISAENEEAAKKEIRSLLKALSKEVPIDIYYKKEKVPFTKSITVPFDGKVLYEFTLDHPAFISSLRFANLENYPNHLKKFEIKFISRTSVRRTKEELDVAISGSLRIPLDIPVPCDKIALLVKESYGSGKETVIPPFVVYETVTSS